MNENIKKAIEIIKQGGIVIYPTDTAYGIGCRINDEKAIRRLFEIRKRPFTMPTPVLFDSIERVNEYVPSIPSEAKKLMEKHWPGALTIVLPCDLSKVPDLVRGGEETLGVRIPDNDIVLALIKGVGIPILGPSSNFHGDPTPYSYEALDKTLIKLVDFVLEGETNGRNIASTVVDCTISPWKIIRQGGVVLDL